MFYFYNYFDQKNSKKKKRKKAYWKVEPKIPKIKVNNDSRDRMV